MRRRYERKNNARVTIGILSLFAGGFFLFNGLVLYGVRENIEKAGNYYLLDLISPFIALGIALLIVTLVAILVPLRVPSSRP